MERTSLISVHPVFALPSTKIFVNENVEKINTHGNEQTRVLIVTNTGLFLLQQHSFPRSTFLSRTIPFSELVLIMIDEEKMQFYCGGVTMNLKHPKHVEIAAIVYMCKLALFGEKPRPIKLQIVPSVQARFDASEFVYETDTILGDRFVSLCLNCLPAKKFKIDKIKELRDILKKSESNVTISASIVASAFVDPYSTAIALDSDTKVVTFSDVSMCSISNSVFLLVNYNSTLTQIIFNNVAFVGKIERQKRVFKAKLDPIEITFNGCDLTSEDFIAFFDAIGNSGRMIKSLIFSSSSFKEQTLIQVFKTIIKAPDLTVLETLSISNVSHLSHPLELSLSELFRSKFIHLANHLHRFEIANCNICVDQILPILFKNDNSIEHLDLSGNQFLQFQEFEKITTLQNLITLNIANCKMTGRSLLALFSIISSTSSMLTKLKADKLDLDDIEWDIFYSKMSQFPTKLVSLSWLYNDFTKPIQASSFATFLKKQTKLKELSISCSDATAETIVALGSGIQDTKIKRLTIKGDKMPKASINSILMTLHSPTYIELENQGGGDSCLELLSVFVSSGSLKELHIDGIEPSSLKSILDFCQSLLKSGVQKATWPEKDVRSLIQKAPMKERVNLLVKAENAKTQFESTMGQRNLDQIQPEEAQALREDRSIETLIREREPNIDDIIRECLNLSEEANIPEPLSPILEGIQESITIKYLLSDSIE